MNLFSRIQFHVFSTMQFHTFACVLLSVIELVFSLFRDYWNAIYTHVGMPAFVVFEVSL